MKTTKTFATPVLAALALSVALAPSVSHAFSWKKFLTPPGFNQVNKINDKLGLPSLPAPGKLPTLPTPPGFKQVNKAVAKLGVPTPPTPQFRR